MEASPSADSVLSLMTWAMWGFVGVAALFYFVYSYLFEILAQKHDEPRWMAWVPFANALLMMKLVGWERWFWAMIGGYAFAFLGMLLPGPLKLLGALAIFPVAIGGLVMGLLYFPVLARRRGLGMGIGASVVLPQIVPPFVEWMQPGWGIWISLLANVAALGAFLRIVFHDGGPPHGPHPIGYVLTLLGVATAGLAVHWLPGYLAQQEGFEEALAQLGTEIQSTSLAGLASGFEGADEAPRSLDDVTPKALRPEEPAPAAIPETCPSGTRERTRSDGRKAAWWCEVEGPEGWVRHGPSRTWHENGYVETEGLYDHGRRTGTWTRYWRSGGRRVQAEFEDDVQQGWMHRWDPFGTLETQVRYEDGQVAVPSA